MFQLWPTAAGNPEEIMKKAIRPTIFKWRQTEPELIFCAVRWYLRYSLSLCDAEELLSERGLEADHTTIWLWVQRYGSELEERLCQPISPGVSMRPAFVSRAAGAPSTEPSIPAARRTIQGYEAMHMIRKGQARWVSGSEVRRQIQFINKLFEVAA